MNYKDITNFEEDIKQGLSVLIIFIISLLLGFFIGYTEVKNKENQIREMQVEIDSLQETIEILEEEENE